MKNLSDTKFLLFTNYSYSVLDLEAPIPEESLIVSNHPTKTAQGAQFAAKTWFDNLKLSQAKYLKPG